MTAANDFGKLVLRVALAMLILFHGVSKIVGGPGWVLGVVTKAGLPAFVAYGVYVGEVLAPLLILIGLWTRPAAFVVVVNMVFALALVHTGDFMRINPTGGWELELQGMYFATALALVFLGAGRYSTGGAGGRFN